MTDWYKWQGDKLYLRVKVQTRASRDEICPPLDDRLKIRITAPPVENQANEHLLRLLAKAFAVPQRQISLLSGASSREKQLLITQPRTLLANMRGRDGKETS